MTGLVRKATLFGVCGLLAASAALANVPDPTTSTVPDWFYAVGVLSTTNLPDIDGANGRDFGPPFLGAANPIAPDFNVANVITIKDFSGNPISGVGVTINLPCDFNLCNINYGPVPADGSILTGQTVLNPDPSKGYCTLRGVTDAAGQWKFAIVANGKNPGNVIPTNPPGRVYEGGGDQSTIIKVDGYAGTFATANTIALDQGGASLVPVGSNGVTAVDAGNVLTDALCYLLGGSGPALYRARDDHDRSITISPIDAGIQLTHFLRVALLGATETCPTASPNTWCVIKPAGCP